MKCIAKDVSAKPNEVRSCNWLVKDQEYTVVALKRNVLSGEQFFVLEEVQPDDPYRGYKVERFRYDINDLLEFLNMDVEELIDEVNDHKF